WRSGSPAGLMKLGTMPLPVDVQTLPLYLWERWRGTPIEPVAELPSVLPYARAGTLVFWWLLLVHVGLAARSLGGRLAAALAVAFGAWRGGLAGPRRFCPSRRRGHRLPGRPGLPLPPVS